MIPDDLFDSLACGARAAVSHAWASAPNPRSEIDHLFSMTTVGIKKLGANWAPILTRANITLCVTGVFCHQTPKARYMHPDDGWKSPELGDLLVVHEHRIVPRDGPEEITRRAVLVQGKMVDRGVPGGGTVDPYQKYLYEHWPDFELKGRGPNGSAFQTGLRNFRPNALDTGRYGLIERDSHACRNRPYFPFCHHVPWTYSEPRQPVRSAGGEDAGTFITNMLYDTRPMRGRTAHPPPPGPLTLSSGTPNNHFDVTVQELLTITGARTLRSREDSPTRRQSVLVCVQVSYGTRSLLPVTGTAFAPSEVDDDGGGAPPEGPSEGDYDDGISVMLIETGRQGGPRRD